MMSESELPVIEMRPYRWGDPAKEARLPDAVAGALTALGAVPAPAPVPPEDATLPGSTLPAGARTALEAAVGTAHVSVDPLVRVAHTRGWSTPDLLRLRAGDAADAPDAVVFPGTAAEVAAVLGICAARHIAVVPFAGGTSVVGGLVAQRRGFAAVIALDVRRLDRLVALDEVSRTATLQAGMRGTAAEALLNGRGYTLGHFPQSYEGAAVGGYAAARSAGQASAGYGRFDEMVVALTLVTPAGTVRLGTAPRSAAGPDLRELVLGSEGAFGVVTDVTVRIRPRPQERIYDGWRFPDFATGAAALRRLAQDGPLPTVLRLSDEAETAVNLADPGSAGTSPPAAGGCLAIAGYEGTGEDVRSRRARAGEVLAAGGGEDIGTDPGERWRAGRYSAPYLRDPLLDAGALVETLETATFWSNLEPLKAAVTAALTDSLTSAGTPALVLCHLSHVYETGASLYFTVACAQAGDPLAQWAAAKAAASSAIRGTGGTITHHHGVGTDHRAIYHQEIGDLAVEALRAVKRTFDPEGICNPGVLI
ncbi:MAG: FAD-binding oxidoreductase [Jatrophihabitans sp.]|nr:MAG: FAD-binding oxidoreductase [Jatrophihabitans sp.]